MDEAEYGIHILVAASQVYVNTYSTCRLPDCPFPGMKFCAARTPALPSGAYPNTPEYTIPGGHSQHLGAEIQTRKPP